MKRARATGLVATLVLFSTQAWADAPVASYIFPAGGQRGTTVKARVGGLNLHHRCAFEMLGSGIKTADTLSTMPTVWFEGPMIPMPASQQVEDYPKDFAATLELDPNATLGTRYWRVWTAEGATSALSFVVGDLPEVVEDEIDGDPIPVKVALPVTVNGRIFPREDVDLWAFEAKQGQTITCEVNAARLGSPLDARIEVLDPQGRPIAESDDGLGPDPLLHFKAPVDGTYQVKILDINVRGGQSLVYRLSLTTAPYVDFLYPLGGPRGVATRFEFVGAEVPSGPLEIVLPKEGPEVQTHRIEHQGQHSNAFLLALSDGTETLESEPNNEPAHAPTVSVPCTANGRIGQPGDVDIWALALKKGEPVELSVSARALGSPLDAIVSVLDKDAKVLARAEAPAKGPLDPSLRFVAPADGTYSVQVSDRYRSHGGARYAYRLRINRGDVPDFQLKLANDAVTVERDKPAKFKVEVERRGGFSGAIELAVNGLPGGVTVSNTTVAANQNAVELAFKAAPDAPIRGARLEISGTAKVGERTIVRKAEKSVASGMPPLDSVLLAVALKCPLAVTAETEFRWAPRGTVLRRRYKIDRGGYEGPIEVRLADRQARHLQGVTGPTMTLPPGESSFDYPVQLPPWMETGRTSRSVVMATATIKDADGTEHEVSYTSPKAEVQIIAVVEPGRLSVEPGRTSVAAIASQSARVPFHLTRGKTLQGAARVELVTTGHVNGISAQPVDIPADQSDGTLVIDFGGSPDPMNAPVILRAMIMDQGDPVVAECKIEVERLRTK